MFPFFPSSKIAKTVLLYYTACLKAPVTQVSDIGSYGPLVPSYTDRVTVVT